MSWSTTALRNSTDPRGDRTESTQDRLGGGAGTASRALALQLVADHVGVQVEERDLFEFVAFSILEQPPQRDARDRPPAQAGDDGVAVEHDSRQRLAHAVRDDAA